MAYDATDFVVTEAPAPVRDPRSITDPRERVAYLRDFLRTLAPERFDMDIPGCAEDAAIGECGSAACVGGWGRALWRIDTWSLCDVGEELGLSRKQAGAMFYPFGELMSDGRAAMKAAPTQAANVLDHYLQTGQIDWSVA